MIERLLNQAARCLAVVLCVLAVGCAQAPVVQTGADAEVIEGGLHRVDHSRADKAYIDPAVKLSAYTGVLVEPLLMDNVEVDFDASTAYRHQEWVLTDKIKATLQEVFGKAFTDAKRFNVASAPGEGVLRLQVELLKLEPNAPADDFKSRPPGRVTYITEGAGAMSIRATFTDSVSGKAVAVVEDRRETHGLYGVNNRITNRQDVYMMFRQWAGQLWSVLEKEDAL